MRNYKDFYRRSGVHLVGHLTNPTLTLNSHLMLPKSSAFHYIEWDGTSNGPDVEMMFIRTHKGRVLVNHVFELHDPIGNPRVLRSIPEATRRTNYHKRYRKLRPLVDFIRSGRNEMTLAVFNYANLNDMFYYQKNMYTAYNQWYNILKTAVFNLTERLKESDHQHFLTLELPKVIPSAGLMRKAAKMQGAMDRKMLAAFSRPRVMALYELWKWIGPYREDSIFSPLNDSNALDRVNIVLKDQSYSIVVNLNTLLTLFRAEEEDIGGLQHQRRFMKMVQSLVDLRTQSEDIEDIKLPDEVHDEDDEDPNLPEEVADEPDDGLDDIFDMDELTGSKPKKTSQKPELKPRVNNEVMDEDFDDVLLDESEDDSDLDRLIAQIEHSEDERDGKVTQIQLRPSDVDNALRQRVDELADKGLLTAAQLKRYKRLIDESENLANPYGGKETAKAFSKVSKADKTYTEKDTTLAKVDGITDPSLLKTTIEAMDSKYVDKVMRKNIVAMSLGLKNAGFIVPDIKVESIETIGNDFESFTMKVIPVDGEPSTLHYRIPKVNTDGVWVSNGTKYRTRKQWRDRPLRKISESEVALTSYYGKLFVERSQKSVVNYARWLGRMVTNLSLEDNSPLTDVKPMDVFYKDVKLPRAYTALSRRYHTLTIDKKYTLMMDYLSREETYGADRVKAAEKGGFVVCGKTGNDLLVMDMNNIIYSTKGKMEPIGTLEELMKLPPPPVEIAEFKLFSRSIPVAIALGHRYGLTELMKILGVKPRRVATGSRLNLEAHEYAIRFLDETLIFERDNVKAAMILAGFNRYHKSIARYSVDAFDTEDLYVNLMEANGIRIGFARELTLAFDMFVDPLTLDLLIEMGEPQTLEELLIRSVELLVTDDYPNEMDREYMRLVGYERFAGAIYSELVRSVRRYRSRGVGTQPKLEMNPEAVWMSINLDAAKSQIEESNPIQNLKERELVTYLGTGGRTSRAMVKRTRAFDQTDVGIMSEASVDSGDVGINAYMTPNANFVDVYGRVGDTKQTFTDPTSYFSTSALLAPCIDTDDVVRIGFSSIQNTHMVAAKGYQASPLKTGYEKAIAQRTTDLFATTAKQDGVVKEVSDKHIVVQYKDGTEVRVELGVRYGDVVGTTVPHTVVTRLKVGDKVKPGHAIAFNEGFFNPDPLNPDVVEMKSSILVKTALMETPYTFEDASVISERLSELLTTKVTKIRDLRVRFDQTIHRMIKVGDEVDIESILCMTEEAITSDSSLFDDTSLDILAQMNMKSFKAELAGRVEKIEVYYDGDMEDMSDSLQALATSSDRALAKHRKAMGKTVITGRVDPSVRLDGDPLDPDTALIRVYITGEWNGSIGDKGTYGHQMKSVFSEVMSGTNITESNVELDAIFSFLSIANRIVGSAIDIGTTITLLKVMSSKVADEYFNHL